MQFSHFLAIEFELNSENAYTPKFIHKCRKMYEGTSLAMKSILRLFLKKIDI